MKNYVILIFTILFEIFGWVSLYKFINGISDAFIGILLLPISLYMLFYLWKNNFFSQT